MRRWCIRLTVLVALSTICAADELDEALPFSLAEEFQFARIVAVARVEHVRDLTYDLGRVRNVWRQATAQVRDFFARATGPDPSLEQEYPGIIQALLVPLEVFKGDSDPVYVAFPKDALGQFLRPKAGETYLIFGYTTCAGLPGYTVYRSGNSTADYSSSALVTLRRLHQLALLDAGTKKGLE